MRDASTCSGPHSIVRQWANGRPSCETSSLVRLARMSRARGPHRPSVVHADVRSVTVAPVGVVGDPLQVGHAVRAAGDDAEVVVARAA